MKITVTILAMSIIVLAFGVPIKSHYNERSLCTLICVWVALCEAILAVCFEEFSVCEISGSGIMSYLPVSLLLTNEFAL